MSMILCDDCSAYINSDDDPECFVEVGNMKRLNFTKIMCEDCRALADELAENDAAHEAAMMEGHQ